MDFILNLVRVDWRDLFPNWWLKFDWMYLGFNYNFCPFCVIHVSSRRICMPTVCIYVYIFQSIYLTGSLWWLLRCYGFETITRFIWSDKFCKKNFPSFLIGKNIANGTLSTKGRKWRRYFFSFLVFSLFFFFFLRFLCIGGCDLEFKSVTTLECLIIIFFLDQHINLLIFCWYIDIFLLVYHLAITKSWFPCADTH